MATPFHRGELAVQERMGQADIAAQVGRMIQADIPDRAAEFLAEQPMVVVAAADDAGRVWASQLIGLPGFTRAVGRRTVAIEAHPAPGDPLAGPLRTRRPIGMIALQPQRRRRIRVNGLAEPTGDGLRITTDQVYPNCPKYISRRLIREFRPTIAGEPVRSRSLNAAQQQTISSVDTFFIGSIDTAGHVDASHRGGNPGFLQALSPTHLRWPDYRGNSMFMTLGNIASDPRCGLLIPDWQTGAVLQLTGTAEINWDTETFAPGAQCSIDFTITEVVSIDRAGPLRWGPVELSPVNPPA